MNQFILKFICGLLLLSSHCNGTPAEQEQIEVMPVESDHSDEMSSDYSDPEIIPVESNESVEPYYIKSKPEDSSFEFEESDFAELKTAGVLEPLFNYSESKDSSFEFEESDIADLRTAGVLEPLFNYSEAQSMDLGSDAAQFDTLPVGHDSRVQVSSYQCARYPATLYLKPWDHTYFRTPNFYGSGYSPYQRCSWKFRTAPGYRLNMFCGTVKLSSMAYLYTTDGSKCSWKTCRQCSQNMWFSFASNNDRTTVALYNFNRYRNKGFSCWIQSVPLCSCGEVPSSRIINGAETSRNKYKWAVWINNYASNAGCGGSLISDQHILTAAHCTVGGTSNPNKVEVLLGVHNKDNPGSQVIKRRALQVIDYPGYVNFYNKDISIIRISPIDFTTTSVVRPICLPWDQSSYVNNYATIAGWGMTATTGSTSSVLRELCYRVISKQSCARTFGSSITSSHICGQRNGVSVYMGDSGGGLFVTRYGYAEHIGITSFVSSKNPTQYPNVYTRTTYYAWWIKKTIARTFTCPPPS